MVAQGRNYRKKAVTRAQKSTRDQASRMIDLTSPTLLESAYNEIASLLRQHAEWLYVCADEVPQSIHREQIDIAITHGRLMLSCWTEKGNRLSRIHAWDWTGQALMLQASRRMGAELSLIELIPRIS